MQFTVSHILVLVAYTVAFPTLSQWAALNETVDGRLFGGIPIAAPCYSNYNGTKQALNGSACEEVQNGYTIDSYIVSQYSGFTNVNWATCQRTGQKCSLDFNLPQNPAVVSGPTCSQGSISPYYIAASSVSDIQAALNFSHQTGIPLSIKNSGHDYKGRSSAPGSLAIWTHNIQPDIYLTENFIPDGCTQPVGDGVTFGAGQGFLGLYEFAEDNGITIVGGASPTVGPGGGWLAGGGHSAVSNVFGLGVDNVLQIRGVLPNGSYVTANECQNPDLWFAWRGGGGSTFGVNYEITTRANPNVELQVVYIQFSSIDPNSATDFISLCIQNANKWASEGWGGYINPGVYSPQTSNLIIMTPKLTLDEAIASMDPITTLANSDSSYDITISITTQPSYPSVFRNFLRPGDVETDGYSTALGSRLIPSSLFNGPANQTKVLKALTSLLSLMENPATNPNYDINFAYPPVQFLLVAPSSFNLTAEEDTSSVTPAWRQATWHVIGVVGFQNSASVAMTNQAFRTAHQAAEILRELVPGEDGGAYQNEADVFQTDAPDAFWGANYARLLRIKKEVDPQNILTCWDCVGWNTMDKRFGCYPQV